MDVEDETRCFEAVQKGEEGSWRWREGSCNDHESQV